MTTTPPKRCPHCNARMTSYAQRLTPGLVGILIKAIQFVHTARQNKFHLQENLNLTKTEYANAQKLRYFGLIAHFDKDNPKSGFWLITARGGQFLRGEIAVPDQVETFRNSVIGHSEELVKIEEFRGKVPEFQREFAWETFGAPDRLSQVNLLSCTIAPREG